MYEDEFSLNKEIDDLYDRLQQAHEERNKYKKALEEIAEQFTPRNAFTAKHDSLVDIAREALK